MKILFLLILISFIVSCKNFKKTSAIKEEETSHSFTNRDIIKELIDMDEQLNSKRQKFNDFLLGDTNYYKDTFAIYLNACLTNGRIKGSEFRDTVIHFTNYRPGNKIWRILVYDGFQRDQNIEKFMIEKHLKMYESRVLRFHFLEYFKYKQYYYVKYYNIDKRNKATLNRIFIIQNNKILYVNLMPFLRMEENFLTPEEHFEFTRDVI